jgi:Zn-finger protein
MSEECFQMSDTQPNPISIESGDSVKFGRKWCKRNGCKDLIGKTVMFTPQFFEDDNGLYSYETECPGIWDEKNEVAESIYHLFGNNLESLMDCVLIKGTQEDRDLIAKIRKENADKEAEYWNGYVDHIMEVSHDPT